MRYIRHIQCIGPAVMDSGPRRLRFAFAGSMFEAGESGIEATDTHRQLDLPRA